MRIILFTFLSLCFQFSYCQKAGSDTIFLQQAFEKSLAYYQQITKNQSILFNGVEYVEPSATNDTHPFFLSNDWINGSVDFNGQKFENTPLLYDAFQGNLVTELPNGVAVALVPEKVSDFTIQGHHFINVTRSQGFRSLPNNTFYEQLYSGKTMVLALKQKERYEKIQSTTSIEVGFDEKVRYYIFHDGNYHLVKNKASIVRLFDDSKSEIKKYIKVNQLDFRTTREIALSKISAYYDQLNQR
jgi:hypothetical protein